MILEANVKLYQHIVWLNYHILLGFWILSIQMQDLMLTYCGRCWWEQRFAPGSPACPSASLWRGIHSLLKNRLVMRSVIQKHAFVWSKEIFVWFLNHQEPCLTGLQFIKAIKEYTNSHCNMYFGTKLITRGVGFWGFGMKWEEGSLMLTKTQISHHLDRAVGGKGHKSDLQKFKTTLTQAICRELNNCASHGGVNFQISGGM